MKTRNFIYIYIAAALTLFSFASYVQASGVASVLPPIISLLSSDEEQTPTATASFNPAIVFTGETSTLTITLTNPNSSPLTGVNIDNDLPAGLTLDPALSSNTCDATPDITAGSGIYNLTDTTVEADSDCVISIAVRGIDAADVGVKTFSTANFTDASDTYDDATATLTINRPGDPTVAAAFNPATIVTGQPTVLTVTITNTDSAALTGISLKNHLPAGLMLDTGFSTNTCDNSPSINANPGRYDITSAIIPANDTCVITLAVAGSSTTIPGVKAFTTSDFTNGIDTFNNASANLTISTPASPTVAAAFNPSTIFTNEETVLTVTLSNPNPVSLESISITNDLPDGLSLNAALSSNTCDPSPSIHTGNGIYNLTNTTLQPNSDCVITIAVTNIDIADVGNQSFSTSAFTDGSNIFSNASANLTVNAAPDPTVTAAFSPKAILSSESTTLTVRVTNPRSTPLSNVNIVNDLPSGLSLDENNSSATCDATPGFNAPAGIYNLTNASIPASTTCIVTIAVTGISAADIGTKSFSTSAFTAGGTGYADASANLGIFDQFPTVSGAFDAASYELGQTGSVVFTISNPGSVTLTGVDFSANLQGGYDLNTATSNATCDPTPELWSSTNRFSVTDATVAAGTSCTVTVNFITDAAGTPFNIWGQLVTNQGNFPPPVTAQPEITPAPPLTITGAFNAASYELGATGSVVFTINNPALIDYTGVEFSANLQGGYDLNTTTSNATCDASPEAWSSTNRFVVTDATVAAGTTCTVTVNFITDAVGTPTNIWGTLITDQGNFPAPVTAQPEITAAPPLTITGAFNAASYELGATGSVVFNISNPALIDYTGVEFSANLQGGYDLNTTTSNASCDGSPEAWSSTNRFVVTDATVAAGTTCTVTVNFITDAAGTPSNIWGTLVTDQGNFPAPVTPQPEITPATVIRNASFNPTSIVRTQTGTLTISINNTSPGQLTGVNFTADLPSGLNLNTVTSNASCDASPTVDGVTEEFGISSATIPGNSTCTLSVNFTATSAGTFTPILSDIASANSGNYSAPGIGSLAVNNPASPTVSGAFVPNPVTVGDTGRLNFRIKNNASIAITINEFGNRLPREIVLVNKGSLASCDASPDEEIPSNQFTVTNATLAAGAECAVSIQYQALDIGVFEPSTGQLETSIGNFSVPTVTPLTVSKP